MPQTFLHHAHLPAEIEVLLFDMDGVLTQSADLHAAAWKQLFDSYLKARGEPFRPFDPLKDYQTYVDGKLRVDGVRDFLASRGLEVPRGEPDDTPDKETLHGLGNRKNEALHALIASRGVATYEDAATLLDRAQRAGYTLGLVTSSKNAARILNASGLEGRFGVQVDGRVSSARGLAGKPAPDMFLAAAEALGAAPERCAVFEDALSGVAAARAGRFGFVVGVDRVGHAQALLACGADVALADLNTLALHTLPLKPADTPR